MRNSLINKRMEILNHLGGLPEPEGINQEWLYILKEETRNSILIEGIIISESELEEVLSKGMHLKKNQNEALNYFRAAKYFYEMAYQNYKTGEFLFSLSISRQINKMLYEGIKPAGRYRKGDIKIAKAKVKPPVPYVIERWLLLYKEYVEQGLSMPDFIRFLAVQHILFEIIHPFDDCNGRTGRIILNYLLLSKGYPPIILKGDDTGKEKYYKALEQGDRVLRNPTQNVFDKDKISKALNAMKTDKLQDLIADALKLSLDRILIPLLEAKKNIKIKAAKEVAQKLKYSPDSIRTLIKRGKFIAVKKGKEWFTHEAFDLTKANI